MCNPLYFVFLNKNELLRRDSIFLKALVNLESKTCMHTKYSLDCVKKKSVKNNGLYKWQILQKRV